MTSYCHHQIRDFLRRGFEVYDILTVYQYRLKKPFEKFFETTMSKRKQADARGDKVGR